MSKALPRRHRQSSRAEQQLPSSSALTEAVTATALTQSQPGQPRQKIRMVRTRRQQPRWLWIAVGIVVLVGCAAIIWFANRGVPANIEGIKSFDKLERTHVPGKVAYAQVPPVGGPHNPVPQNCGAYGEPIANENGVHSLEHGAVWITYRPNLSAEAVTQLRGLVSGKPYTLLSPYKDLPSPVVASAWGLQLPVESVSDPRLAQFMAKYANGPQNPEPGAPCTGGVGDPLSYISR